MISLADLRARQAMPLELKVRMSETRIREWVARLGWYNVSVSYSGGKDSTVLLHLVRSLYPSVPAVFACTGLEYPEILEQVRATENVTWVRPKKSFREVIEKYGWPVVSRRVSQYVKEARTSSSETLRSIRTTHDGESWRSIPDSWMHLCDAPFNVSDACCKWLKHDALDSIPGKPFIGTMAENGQSRELSYLQHGCNLYDAKRPLSRPMSFWCEHDVWEYIRANNLRYSTIYEKGYTRTGCMFCPFGLHLEKRPHRFDLMRDTHPKQYEFIMEEMGLREVLEYVYRDKPQVLGPLQTTINEVAS